MVIALESVVKKLIKRTTLSGKSDPLQIIPLPTTSATILVERRLGLTKFYETFSFNTKL